MVTPGAVYSDILSQSTRQELPISHHIRIWSFSDVDRSGKVRWTAQELGYEIEESRLPIGGLSQAPYRHMNPFEQVPTVELEGRTYIESTAF
jgi:glutathione S-transferase